MNITTTSAPAKIILLGEHAVVYGIPALAVPVSSLRTTASITAGDHFQIVAEDTGEIIHSDQIMAALDNALALMARLTLDTLACPAPSVTIRLRSDIPPASGLGSGASVSATLGRAIVAACNRTLDNTTLNALVYEVERTHHGTPSGIDNTVIVYERPVYFVRGSVPEAFAVQQPLRFVVANTGQIALTKIAVGDVRQLYERDTSNTQKTFDRIAEIVKSAKQALASGDFHQLGTLMNENHRHLQNLTVSSPELDALVIAARSAGAIGAKLSGGGRGGNMIALVTEETESSVSAALLNAGAVSVFTTLVS